MQSRAAFNINIDLIIIDLFLVMIFGLPSILVPKYSGLLAMVSYVVIFMVFIATVYGEVFLKKSAVQTSPLSNHLLLLISVFMWLTALFVNFTQHGFGLQALSNLFKILVCLMAPTIFLVISTNYGFGKKVAIVRKVNKTFNFLFWINVPIIMAEYFTKSFIIAKYLSVNPTLEDQMTGLIGINGTAIMSVFWIALLFGNFLEWKLTHKKTILISVSFQLLFMSIDAIFISGIKSFFASLVFVVLVFEFLQLSRLKNSSSIFKAFLLVGSMVFVLSFAYYMFAPFQEIIDKSVELISSLSKGTFDGTDIRVKTFWFATNDAYNLGLNGINFSTQSFFPQLDVISLNVLLVFGGWFFAAVSILVLTVVLLTIFWGSSGKRSLFDLFAFMLLVIYFCLVTVPYSSYQICFFISYLSLCFNCIVNQHDSENNKIANIGKHNWKGLVK